MEVVCNGFGAGLECLVKVGERGSNSSEFYFIYLNQDISFVTCFLDVSGLSDSQLSIDRAIGA